MADALNDLTVMIDRIKADAFKEGYAAAMTQIQSWASAQVPIEIATTGVRKPLEAARSPTQGSRAKRGENKQRVLQVLRSVAPRPISAKQIQDTLNLVHNVEIPYSSIQNAMFQIVKDGTAETVARGSWRLKTVNPDSDYEDLLA